MQISKNDKNYKANKLTQENENHLMHVITPTYSHMSNKAPGT